MKHRLFAFLLLFAVICPGLSARKYAGGDISLLPLYEQLRSKYYDYDGKPLDDVIRFYADEGMNLMRVRLLVNPSDFPGGTADSNYNVGKNWSYDPNCCQTLDYILPICRRIQAAGMNLLLDFHYTDYWADPEHQWTPESWKHLDDNGLCDKLYSYTKESLEWLRDRGVVPQFIQTGNEISFGMLYGPFGTSQADLKVAKGENDDSCWRRLTDMLKAAGRACREICPDAQIVIHTEQLKNHWNLWNFYRQMGDHSVDYDIIGLSYYPYWHVDIAQADAELSDLEKCFPDKKIWIVEFNWPYSWEADGANALYDKYPHTPEGQNKITSAVIDMLNEHPNANGLIWWWPEFNKKDYEKPQGYVETWDGWYSSPLFSSYDGRALPATRTLASYAENETVYFTNVPKSWTSVGLYAWSSGHGAGADWPGVAAELTDMTYKGKPVWKYSFSSPDSHDYLILNNRHQDADGNWVSSDQTFDMTFKDGMIYYIKDWRDSDGNGGWKYGYWEQDATATFDSPCFYLTNLPDSWTNPCVTAWNEDNNNEVQDAPLELTDYSWEGKKVYKFSFTGSRHHNMVLFNGPWDGKNISVDLNFANGVLYVLSDGPNAEGDSKYSAPYIVDPSFDGNTSAVDELTIFGNINGQENWAGDYDRFKALRKGISDNTYTFNIHLRQKSWFRLRDGNGVEYGPEQDTDLHNGDNDKTLIAGSTKAFNLDPGTYTIVVYHWYDNGDHYQLAVGDQKAPAVHDDLYVVGSFTGWAFDHDFRLERQADGTYSREFAQGLPAGTFKIAVRDWSPQYSAGAVDVPLNHTIRCHEMDPGGQDMVMPSTSGWSKVIFDPLNHTIRVEGPKDAVSESYQNRVYMHFGQSRQTYGDLNEVPRVHLFADNRPDVPSDEEVTGWNTFDMKPALEYDGSYDLWYYELTEDQKSWAQDATFFFKRKDNGKIEKFTCGRMVDDDDLNWDYRQWMKYIYFADVADNYNNKATQSYLTLLRFRELRNGAKDKLYMVGQGLNRLHPTAGWQTSGWNRIIAEDIYSADASWGVFYVDNIAKCQDLALSNPIVDNDENKKGADRWGAKFKMSWIYPYGVYVGSGCSGGDINQQRAWATFNLGIIGYGLRRAAAVNLYPERAKNQTNYEVYCASCQTLPTNNFNQWDWFVEEKFLGGNYTLVVDLHDSCGSATLLPFEPNPTASGAGIKLDSPWLDSYDEAMTTWSNNPAGLLAEGANGKHLYRKFNVATATIDVKAPNSEQLQKENYSVEYEMYLNGSQRGLYHGKPGKVALTGVPVGDEARLGIRAKYTDNTTRFAFHSKYSEASNQLTLNLPAPVVGDVVTKCYADGHDNGDDTFSLGAYMYIPVEGSHECNWYGDYELMPGDYVEGSNLSKGGEVLYYGHPAHGKMQGGVTSASLEEWSPYSGDGEGYAYENDWSHQLSAQACWPLYLPAVKNFRQQTSYTDEELSTDINVKIHSVYPFMIDLDAMPVGVEESAQSSVARRGAPIINGHRYELHLIRTTAQTNVRLGRESISGIENLLDDEGDNGQARYFNLQGMEVKGQLAPGVYIRQQGNVATKVRVP